ncbi:MAG: arylsulfatase [Chloroflexi bacterium]|nr:arylsulfatase [Chloroflexota bacterium]
MPKKTQKRQGSKKRLKKTDGAFPTKVDRNVYPKPEYRFPDAKIGFTYESSVADFPKPYAAPEGAPNILLVLLDDVGFGWPSTFGGGVRMPTADRLAKNGLSYNQFHTTALCSPTRAALLTGRNHHTVHTGTIGEMGTGFPGYDGIIPKSCATIADLLSQNGYATGWWGKNHNVPDNQTSEAGPFDNWPTSQGFDYFYGFIGGETDQFYPCLYRGTRAVAPPDKPEDGYQVTRDLANDCIDWMRRQKAIAPDRPFFAYFSTGAAHAPHQPPLDWRGRNKGRFDMGWDEYRRQVHQRQLEMGVIPPGTGLTERPKEIPAWDDATAEEKRLYARFAENFADFLEHTDFEVGRVVDAVEGMGELENTLVIYIIGDNGSSAEGTLTGEINELLSLNGFQPDVKNILRRIDDIGLPGTSPHYPVGWAWAGDAPFQWTKQIASHFGGTRNGTIISWPARISDKGTVRSQFHHVIDIAPTILEVVGISEPAMVNGVPQKPIEGVSMAYTFAKENRDTPTRRYTQYFEMFGHRALYHDGWIACCRHGRLPWVNFGSADFSEDEWELYHIDQDFSEAVNLADEHPEKLRELQDLFMAEAAKYNVLPLDDRFIERADVSLRPSYFYGRKSVTFYPGMIRLPEGSAPKTHNVTHTITVDAHIPKDGAEGVLVCLGGDTAGWSLFMMGGKLVYHYNWFDEERYEVVSKRKVPAGKVELRCHFENETDVPGGPATVTLYVNGKAAGSGKIEKQVRGRFGVESLDVGVDAATPVSRAYADKQPFWFTGEIEQVRFDFGDGTELSPREKAEQHIKMD